MTPIREIHYRVGGGVARFAARPRFVVAPQAQMRFALRATTNRRGDASPDGDLALSRPRRASASPGVASAAPPTLRASSPRRTRMPPTRHTNAHEWNHRVHCSAVVLGYDAKSTRSPINSYKVVQYSCSPAGAYSCAAYAEFVSWRAAKARRAAGGAAHPAKDACGLLAVMRRDAGNRASDSPHGQVSWSRVAPF